MTSRLLMVGLIWAVISVGMQTSVGRFLCQLAAIICVIGSVFVSRGES